MTAGEYDVCSCKVGRKIAKYDLETLDSDLKRQYIDEEASLRDLEEIVNASIVEKALDGVETGEGADVDMLVIRGDEIVSKLRDDDVPKREQIKPHLEQLGLDVRELRGDFVTYRTIRDHLHGYLEVDTSRKETVTIESGEKTIDSAKTLSRTIISKTVDRLKDTNEIAIDDDFDISLSPQITCRECGSTFTASELLRTRIRL